MGLSEKEQADILARIYKEAWLNFDRRRNYEWKLSLGVWTATAAFIALSLGREVEVGRLAYLRNPFCWLAAVILVIQFLFL